MPDISKIQLPGSGGVYNIKDAVAREMISGGVSFVVAWDGSGTPDVGAIPAGVEVKYNGLSYYGILAANDESVQAGAFYLVKSNTTTTGAPTDVYDEYVPVEAGDGKRWEKIGDTQIDLTNVVTHVILNKQTDVVLGEGTTFTNSDSNVTFSGGTNAAVLGAKTTFQNSDSNVTFSGGSTDRVLGEGTSFTTTVTPGTTYLGATTSSENFVTGVTAETNKNLDTTKITGVDGTESVSAVSKNSNKLVTTTVANITGNTDVSVPNITGNSPVQANNSTWEFKMGEGDNSETLIITGENGTPQTATNTALGTANTASKVTLGTEVTVATGSIAANGTGSEVLGGLTINNKTVAKAAATQTTVATGTISTSGGGDAVVTGVAVGESAPALTGVNLTANTASGTGRVQVVTGITGATTTAVTTGADSDVITAITDIGTGTAAAQTITVGANDKPTVVKTIGTATAAAQTITVGSNDNVTVLTEQTSLTEEKGNQ